MRKPLTDTLLRALKKPAKGRLELADASCRGLNFKSRRPAIDPGASAIERPAVASFNGPRSAPIPEYRWQRRGRRPTPCGPGWRGRESQRGEAARKAGSARPDVQGAVQSLPDRICAAPEEIRWDQDERNLNLHVLPKWKDRDYTTLRRADVIELVEGILSDGKPVLANRGRASFPWFSFRG